MASFGERRRDNIGSFGRPAQEPEPQLLREEPAVKPAGQATLTVDLVVSQASLQRVTADIAAAVRRGVEQGFASAGTGGEDDEDEIDPEQT